MHKSESGPEGQPLRGTLLQEVSERRASIKKFPPSDEKESTYLLTYQLKFIVKHLELIKHKDYLFKIMYVHIHSN